MRNNIRAGFIFILIIFFFFEKAFPQENGAIKGKIITAEGTPVSYATIEFKNTKRKTVADKEGFFEIKNLSLVNDTLIITGLGFVTFKKFVYAEPGRRIDLGIISLEYAVTQLQDVEITGRIEQSYKSGYSFLGTKTQAALKDIPQSVSTVTKELLKDKGEMRLKDAANDVAGLSLYSGLDEFTIRGFRAENPYLVNGLRTYNTSLISPLLVNIERIEVIKGPIATLYGNTDPGGTINLVTKKPLPQKKYEIDISKGSWNNISMQSDFTGPLDSNKNFLYRFNAAYENTKSFRNQFFAKSFELAPSLSFIPNKKMRINLDVSIEHSNTVVDRGQPGFMNDTVLSSTPISLMVTQPGDYLHETDIATIVSFSYAFNKHLTFNSAYLNYLTWQDFSEHGIKDYITPDSVYLYYTYRSANTVTHNLSNYFNFQFNTGKWQHRLLMGYDFIQSNVDLTQWNGELPDQFGEDSKIVGTFSLRNPQYFSRPVRTYEKEHDDDDDDDEDIYHTHGIYIQEQASIQKWQVLVGMREELYFGDEKDFVFLPKAGVIYSVNPDVNIYATYSKGFDPFEASIITQVYDEPFKPIISELMETGVKTDFLKNKLSASLTVYYINLKNVAVNANDISNPDLYIQKGGEQSKGIEAEVNGNISQNLSIAASYAYNVAKISKSEIPAEVGKVKENAPRNSSSTWIKYIFTKGFSIAAGHSQEGVQNTLADNLQLPAYCILNAALYYTKKRFSIGMNINNLTNQTYWTAAYNYVSKWPGAPRNYRINVECRF